MQSIYRASGNLQNKGKVPEKKASYQWPAQEEEKLLAGRESKTRQRRSEKKKRRESPIYSMPRWSIFLFFPFISVKAQIEQKTANADEMQNQPDCVVLAVLLAGA